MAMLEAIACCKTLIDFVSDNGPLFKPGDPEDLAA
jgi:hypothetical protein